MPATLLNNRRYENYFLQDPMAITNREQKLLAEMAQLNLLDDPKLMVNINCLTV